MFNTFVFGLNFGGKNVLGCVIFAINNDTLIDRNRGLPYPLTK